MVVFSIGFRCLLLSKGCFDGYALMYKTNWVRELDCHVAQLSVGFSNTLFFTSGQNPSIKITHKQYPSQTKSLSPETDNQK